MFFAGADSSEQKPSSRGSSTKVVVSGEAPGARAPMTSTPSLTDSIRKGLLKSMSTAGGSQEKAGGLDAKQTANRAPSPIPEDPREDESKAKASAPSPKPTEKPDRTSTQKSKDSGAGGSSQAEAVNKDNKEKDGDTKPEKETNAEEQATEKKEDDAENKEGAAEAKKEDKPKKDPPKTGGPSAKPVEPVSTTKLRGKSKATGKVMGGWL